MDNLCGVLFVDSLGLLRQPVLPSGTSSKASKAARLQGQNLPVRSFLLRFTSPNAQELHGSALYFHYQPSWSLLEIIQMFRTW